MRLDQCPPSVAILEIPDATLRIEISTSPSAFRRAGAYGIAPIGSFADWAAETEARRKALDAVVSCVERSPPEALLPRDASANTDPHVDAPHRSYHWPSPPWLLVAAAICALIGCRPRAVKPIALSIAAVVATFLIRRALQPAAFFHQNGHGPLWVRFALLGDAGAYGPGYPEMFRWIVEHAKRPDRALFLAQECLAALAPVAAYSIARSRANWRGALVVGAAVALNPILTRTARSESYFATIGSLLMIAGALLVAGDRRGTRDRFLLWIAAGLVAAQSARIHPLAWVPCAALPLVILCRSGSTKRRLLRTGIAALVVGVVALAFALPTIRATLHAPLGGAFMPNARAMARGLLPVSLVLVGIGVVIAGLTSAETGRRAVVLSLVAAAIVATNVVGHDAAVVSASYTHLFAPAVVGALAFRPVLPIALVAILAIGQFISERRVVVLPTDALELSWSLDWRDRVPLDATVTYLERADKRVLTLPLYGPDLPRPFALDTSNARPQLRSGSYYYRSSVCAAPEAASYCRALEAEAKLRRLEARTLPARGSLPWLPLPPGEIEVALFIVE